MSDPISVAGTAVGVISLGLTVCQGLLQYYSSWKEAQKDVAAMFSSLEGLTRTLQMIELTIQDRKFDRKIVERVTESIASCDTGVKSLDKKLTKVKALKVDGLEARLRAQVRRALYPFKESTLMKLRETISDLRDNLSLAINILQIDMSAMSLQKMRGIDEQLVLLTGNSTSAKLISENIAQVQVVNQMEQDKRLKDEKRSAVLQWLSPIQFGAKQSDLSNQRQEGTGNWLLRSDEFVKWLNGTSRTLWCPGMPGAGKTILASRVIDYIEQTVKKLGIGIAYLYCNYKEHNQTGINLVASLLQQLLRHQPDMPVEITELYDHHSARNTRPAFAAYSKALLSQVPYFSDVFLVVDALDECSDDARNNLLDVILNLPSNTHLLATSRKIAIVERRFQEAARLDIEAKDEDVRTYLEAWLDGPDICASLVRNDRTLRDTLLNTITQRINGMFLLAELHKNLLAGEDNRRDLLRTLQNLPAGLDDTYDRAMGRINSQSQRQVKRAEQVLSWIIFAERALTVKELQCALAVEPDDTFLDEGALPDVDLVVSVCAGLVVIDQENSIIRLVHYTTQEYFERTRETRFPHAQRELASTCLTYLSFAEFANGLCVKNDKEHDRHDDYVYHYSAHYKFTRDRIEKNVLLDYAARHWGNHAREVFRQDPNISQLIWRFFENGGNLACSVEVERHSQSGDRRLGAPVCLEDVPNLHVAASFGLDEIVKLLLEEGISVDVSDSYGGTALHKAARNGHVTMVQMLLERGADTKRGDRDGWTALAWAASAGHETVVRILLKEGSDLSNHDYERSLIYAASGGHMTIVQLLLQQITDAEVKQKHAFLPLLSAAENGHEAVVRSLLEHAPNAKARGRWAGAALKQAASNNRMPVLRLLLEQELDTKTESQELADALWEAAAKSHVPATKVLLEAGADPNVRQSWAGDPTLLQSCHFHSGHSFEILQLLLEKGANIEARNYQGRTAIIQAAKHGNREIVRLLIGKGADVAVKDNEVGRTALQWAILYGHEAVVCLLRDRAPVSDEVKKQWRTLTRLYRATLDDADDISEILADSIWPLLRISQDLLRLHCPAARGNARVAKLLLDMGADVDVRDEDGKTALSIAAGSGSEEVVGLLLSHGANVDAEDSFGETPLINAAVSGHTAVVQMLLEGGANLEIQSKERGRSAGGTALLEAVTRYDKNEAVIQLLLERGADIEAVDTQGRTPLIRAAGYSRALPGLARLLLDKGAKLEAKDPHGRTALVIATEWGTKNVVQLLLERGADPNAVGPSVTKTAYWLHQDRFDETLQLVREAQQQRHLSDGSRVILSLSQSSSPSQG
ncbi:MAG: hypothetical protein M1830_006717 [Pleopsidium flavum]|nr:MAG: hypothetical protein M1830_006717 [Pleopsidium flavum]